MGSSRLPLTPRKNETTLQAPPNKLGFGKNNTNAAKPTIQIGVGKLGAKLGANNNTNTTTNVTAKINTNN